MRVWRRAALLAVVGWAVLVPAPPVLAHASLVSTSPTHGATVDPPPGVIELVFDGPVTPIVDAFSLRSGDRVIEGEVRLEGTVVSFVPAGTLPDGTAVFDWRVVSDDGHPIGGKLVFHVREATVTVTGDEVTTEDAGPSVAVLTALAYLGILLGAGLSFFAAWVLGDDAPGTARLRSRARSALAVGVAAAIGSLLLQGLEIAGRLDLGALPAGSLPMLALLAAGAGLLSVSTHPLSVAVGLLPTLISLAFVGHTRSYGPAWAMVGSDAIHLVAGSVWAGGLAGLAVVARRRPEDAAAVTRRFGSIAAWCLAAVFLSGAVMTLLIHDSPRQVLATTHGRLALAKAGLVVAAAAIALLNRRSASGRRQAERLGLTVPVEAAIVAAVLVVAGFLVEQNPSAGGGAATMGDAVVQTSSDGYAMTVRFDPGAPGVNTVSIRVLGVDGTPLALEDGPRVVIAAEGGSTSYETTPDGSVYSATVELPDARSWAMEVRARVDTFTEATRSIRVDDGRVVPGAGLLMTGAVMAEPVAGADTASLYGTLVPAADGALVGGSSPACRAVSIHESVTGSDGLASMEPRDRLDLRSGAPVAFTTGGLHIMCEGLVGEVRAGDLIPFVLETADGARHPFVAEVVPLADLLD